MTISKEDVKKVAHLAKLDLSDEAEIALYVDNLSKLVELVSHINDEDTTQISPMLSAFDTTLRLRKDEVLETDAHAQLQSFTSHTKSGFYVVPLVIE